MLKVVMTGTILVIFVYCIAATFGYLTWVGSDEEKTLRDSQNILMVDYEGNIAFTIALLGLCVAIFAAAPMCILPSKDSYEMLMYPGRKMTDR
jgi:amino acid permease